MKKRVLIVLSLLLIIVTAFVLLYNANTQSAQQKSIKNPFQIEISEPHIIQEAKQHFNDGKLVTDSGTEQRLQFTISILNTSEYDFSETWFEASLNDEVKPFIASQVISYRSGKFDVTSEAKADLVNNKNNLKITGFNHNWSLLLTTPDDLADYNGMTPDEIVNALRSIHVQIHWDSGTQEQDIPISVQYE